MNFWAAPTCHLHWEFLLSQRCLILSCRYLVGMSSLLSFVISSRSMDSMFRSNGQRIPVSELLFLGMGSLSLSLAGWWIYLVVANPHLHAGEDGLELDDFFQCDRFAYCLEDSRNHLCSSVKCCCFVMSSKHERLIHHLVVYRTFLQQLPILTDWQLCQ